MILLFYRYFNEHIQQIQERNHAIFSWLTMKIKTFLCNRLIKFLIFSKIICWNSPILFSDSFTKFLIIFCNQFVHFFDEICQFLCELLTKFSIFFCDHLAKFTILFCNRLTKFRSRDFFGNCLTKVMIFCLDDWFGICNLIHGLFDEILSLFKSKLKFVIFFPCMIDKVPDFLFFYGHLLKFMSFSSSDEKMYQLFSGSNIFFLSLCAFINFKILILWNFAKINYSWNWN